jgi:inorganic phosphate transporter, PiT family
MTYLLIIIALALIFDFINGFHDAANSIATVVSTRVLSPFIAVLWAAFFNSMAYFIPSLISHFTGHPVELGIADTVAKTVDSNYITLTVICGGLIAAIIWNLLTWWLGIPSSSSHTLIGGFAGSALMHAISHTNDSLETVVKWDKVAPTLYFILLAPILGMVLSYIISIITMHIVKKMNPSRVDKVFRKLQLLSSAAFSVGHGSNDAQKVVGIMAAAILAANKDAAVKASLPDWLQMNSLNDIHSWMPIMCFVMIGIGTMSGGWKIVKTMGQKVTKLTPFEGFSAETAGAMMLYATAHIWKIPVSTTHTITGSIIGTGMIKRVSAVRWGVTINLLWAWILTIPVSGLLGALIYKVVSLLIGQI